MKQLICSIHNEEESLLQVALRNGLKTVKHPFLSLWGDENTRDDKTNILKIRPLF